MSTEDPGGCKSKSLVETNKRECYAESSPIFSHRIKRMVDRAQAYLSCGEGGEDSARNFSVFRKYPWSLGVVEFYPEE